MIKYVLDRYKPDLALVGYPVTDEFQHQFLGLVTKRLPNGARTRPTTTSRSTAHRTAASRSGSASSGALTKARTRRCGWRGSVCATAS